MDRQVIEVASGREWPGFARGPVYMVKGKELGSVALVGQTLAGWLGGKVALLSPDNHLPLSATLANAAAVVLERPPSCGCGNPLCGNAFSQAGCPLLLVPARLPSGWPGEGPMLAPLDGSDDASMGATVARELAARASCGLEVLHVAVPAAAATAVLPFPRLLDQAHHEWRAWHHAFLSRFCSCADAQTPLWVRSGAPAHEILEVARQRRAALIVLTWHGVLTPGRARTLAGVIEGADRPILLAGIPQKGRASLNAGPS
jgi:nucleotide-binding universal stress UspA family protein